VARSKQRPSAAKRLAIDERGYANLARQIRSPNYDARPADTAITLLVIHGISLPPGEFGGDAIVGCSPTASIAAHPYYSQIARLRVSAHFVRRDGALLQFVSSNDRAWHAGVSSWRRRDRCNDFSIGIELEGADDVPYAGVSTRAGAASRCSCAVIRSPASPANDSAGAQDGSVPLSTGSVYGGSSLREG
jgi:AmpD protein